VRLRWLFAILLTMATMVVVPSASVLSAASFNYDAPTITRVDGHAFEVAEASPAVFSDVREGSASPSAEGRAPSTTPMTPVVATEAVDDLEHTPSTHPGEFDPVRGSPAKRHKSTGEIWEPDRLHKDHYEVYKNKRDWEKGKRNRSVWDDGRLKECF
jgi:hypothetical protein